MCANSVAADPAVLAVERVKNALAREVTEEILGADLVRAFDEQGYVDVVSSNGYTYSIFPPVPSRSLGVKSASRSQMSWCVFGADPRADEGGRFPYPCEHFFAFYSRYAPVHEELVWVWFALKDDPRPFLVDGCDPLATSGDWKRVPVSRMLRKIGRELGKAEYLAAYDRTFLSASSS